MLLEAIGATTPEERFKIALRYKDLFEEDLKDVMESETSGDFGLALKMCSFGPAEAECYMIHRACKGLGSAHEKVLYSIVCGRSNRDMELLKKSKSKLNTDICKVLRSYPHHGLIGMFGSDLSLLSIVQ